MSEGWGGMGDGVGETLLLHDSQDVCRTLNLLRLNFKNIFLPLKRILTKSQVFVNLQHSSGLLSQLLCKTYKALLEVGSLVNGEGDADVLVQLCWISGGIGRAVDVDHRFLPHVEPENLLRGLGGASCNFFQGAQKTLLCGLSNTKHGKAVHLTEVWCPFHSLNSLRKKEHA